MTERKTATPIAGDKALMFDYDAPVLIDVVKTTRQRIYVDYSGQWFSAIRGYTSRYVEGDDVVAVNPTPEQIEAIRAARVAHRAARVEANRVRDEALKAAQDAYERAMAAIDFIAPVPPSAPLSAHGG